MSATLRVRERSRSNAFVSRSGAQNSGAAIVEAIIALPILLVVILGAIQFGLIYQAKATLNHAALQAARSGAVDHASANAIRSGLAKGLLPLYSPDSSLSGVATTLARINGELTSTARIRILNPTREAFADFGEDVEGVREIPNDRLHTRSTTVGTQSGLNIQDANILRVEITYGYELKVPLVNWFITRTLLIMRGSHAPDAFEQQLLRRALLPIVATSTVRMQSPARFNDLFVARADLPTAQRIDASSAPPDIEEEEEHEEEVDDEDSAGDEHEDSSLADAFFGFGGGGPAGGSGGEVNPGGGEGGSDPGTGGGGENTGNPQMCSVDDPGQDGPPFGASHDAALDASQPAMLPSLSVGNPIHVVTGNKYQLEIDLPALPGANGLLFARHYNTDAARQAGLLGAGWRHSYQASLQHETARDAISIVQADGRRVHFARDSARGAGEAARFIARRASDGYVDVIGDESIWHPSSQRALRFDARGRLVAVTIGTAETRLHYDRRGRLARVEDAQNRALEFVYYRNGRLRRLGTPVGIWRYRYDDAGNLSAVESPDTILRRYEYGDSRHPHHLTSITAQTLGLAAYGATPETIRLGTWQYDEHGRGVLSTHPDDAGKVTLSYGDGYTDVTDAFGRTSRYTTELRDGIAIVTEVRGPGCGTCGPGDVRYRYDERLQVTDTILRSGIGTHHTYDDLGRRIETARSVQGGQPSWQTRYFYEGTERRARRIERPSINPDGVHSLEFAYTEDGAIKSVSERGYTSTPDGRFAPIARETGAAYDAAGRMISIDGPREGAVDLTRFEYDAAQRLVATVDAEGFEQRVLARDAAGRPTRLRRSGSPEVELRYDPSGRLTTLIEHRASGKQIRSFAYDAAGRAVGLSRADGSVQQLGRDSAGRINRREQADGFIQASLFGADGQLAKRALLGDSAILNVLHFAYDAQRRLIEVRDGDGPPLRQVIYTDDDALADRILDVLGRETELAYDDLGRLIMLTGADGGTTRFEYTARGALENITAPNGAQTRYEYDDFGRRIRERSADRGTTHYAYDSANNLVEKTDARGSTTTFTYTPGNLIETVTSAEGTTRFAYANRRVARVSGPWGAESYEYDADGRLRRHTRHIADRTFTTAYQYDEQGRISKRRFASGKWLVNEYDDEGTLTTIALDGLLRNPTLISTQAKSHGALSPFGDLEFGNALAQDTSFDERGRLRTRRLRDIADLRYHYDEANRLTRVDDGTQQKSYAYDAANRLVAAIEPERVYRYTYDANGNRLSMQGSSPSTGATHPQPETHAYVPGSNRLLPAERGSEDVLYDAAGRLLRSGKRRYEYNGSGRPVRLYVNERLTAEYAYNTWGERIRKTVHTRSGTRTTLYLYEQHRLIAEADERGRINREYVYLDHHPVALLERGVLHWIHTNHIGAPIAVTDSKRRIVWRAEYAPFGLADIDEDPDGDGRTLELNLRLPGQYADAESGTYYNVIRDYDPALGRYLTPDPLGVLAGLNSYAYVHNNPTNGFDSLGLYDEMVHYYITYFLGIVAGLPQDVARTIAVAAQYVDENPLTAPVNYLIDANERALPLYHFVMGQQGPLYGDATTDILSRFYNPTSTQLDNLFASTDVATLQRLWQEAHPNLNACPTPWTINNARYQLFGEYLHTYEDTFAHRDTLNMPYGVESNPDNTPMAFYGGHTGLGTWNPLSYQPPDHTFNQDLPDNPAECLVGNGEIRRGLSEQTCQDLDGYYIPEQTNEWNYNELRTLRMQYEVFRMLGENFSEEIATNRQTYAENSIPLPTISWQDLAGRAWDEQNPEANARIGSEQTYDEWRSSQGLQEIATVLQRFNSSNVDQDSRRAILNEWLSTRDFVDSNGDPIRIERWSELEGGGASDRWENIGWIPSSSFLGLLLPRDEECQQIRNLPGDCDDRPRR